MMTRSPYMQNDLLYDQDAMELFNTATAYFLFITVYCGELLHEYACTEAKHGYITML